MTGSSKRMPVRRRTPACRLLPLSLAIVAALAVLLRAEAPHIYAITGARIVTVSGPPIASGTVVIRDGLIQAAGADVAVPSEAAVVDGKGLTVWPGLIDLGSSAGLSASAAGAPATGTRLVVERARRETLLRPQLEAASQLELDAPALRRAAAAGITSVLAVPPGEMIRGRSSLVSTFVPDEEPQIGNVAGDRRGLFVLRSPVALHVSFPGREGGGTYPASLMGAVAFVRQAFLDAGHYGLQAAQAERLKKAIGPPYDPGFEAMLPAVRRVLPVAFEAADRAEIRRALTLARELKLEAVISGGVEADRAVDDLKSQKTAVIYTLNYPTRSKALAPDADEPVAALRQRANAPRVPAALDKAGVPFAFQSAGLADPRDFVKNAGKAVKAGLPAEAAIRALTLSAARIAGVADRLGSIEKGKIANLLVTDGDLFDEKTKVQHVYVNGRPVVIQQGDATPGRRR